MPSRSDGEWARDILRAVGSVREHQRWHSALGPDDAGATRALLVDALTYQVMSMGEAAKNLSVSARDAHPTVPWRSVIGMRDLLAHHYHRRDERIVLATVESTVLDRLSAAAQSILDT